ncbi:BLUF domain-containing protein [Paraburkholderia sp. MMS20-SJTR3]|uniref:BLUF domain-containing protein n=1 Tax=Paraburkholderia sejongensis TaxID=2886946 RepID=A0ABS8K3X1_9BURK|nr:BLUF domain-containing protein [Paraburkholderia sp. MMS20-SJTR3]MCC8396856.1 BLUF domain-containing protein [Paraburkholderia sp. MMS20-SJTR3]
MTTNPSDKRNSWSRAAVFGAAYISRVSHFLKPADIALIVEVSRRHNEVDAISGFLVKAGSNFLQYLEGPRVKVVRCLRRIESDRRHYDMRILALGAMQQRHFSDWSMGFFVGDVDGSERFESLLTEWHGTDRSLLEEVWRISAISRAEAYHVRPEVIVGPFQVLLKRRE